MYVLSLPGTSGASKLVGFSLIFFNIFSFGIAKLIGIRLFLSSNNSLLKYKPDLVVLAGFMRILSPLFVNKYLGKLINIHPSLLPKYKGLDTHKRVLENNEEYHGVTVHFVDNTLDGGPICAQSSLKVETTDIDELKKAIHELEHELYPRVINQIANKKIYLSDGEIIKKL